VLNRNIEQNSLSAVFSTHQIALAANDGDIEFFRDEDDCSSSLLMSTNRDRHSGKTIRVPSRRLSAFIDSDIDLLKLDVEGAELEILHEIEAANKFRFIHRIHLEYHHHIGNAPDSMSSILRLLEGNGFGYQISASQGLDWPKEKAFQDISLYCYRR
jgi:FkbM family methyltransferase